MINNAFSGLFRTINSPVTYVLFTLIKRTIQNHFNSSIMGDLKVEINSVFLFPVPGKMHEITTSKVNSLITSKSLKIVGYKFRHEDEKTSLISGVVIMVITILSKHHHFFMITRPSKLLKIIGCKFRPSNLPLYYFQQIIFSRKSFSTRNLNYFKQTNNLTHITSEHQWLHYFFLPKSTY